jgi:hypothetical protein
MNHEAVEGAIDSTSYESGSSRTNVPAMDQGAVEESRKESRKPRPRGKFCKSQSQNQKTYAYRLIEGLWKVLKTRVLRVPRAGCLK